VLSITSTTSNSAAPTSAIEWSKADVAAWLERIGTAYSKYKAAFTENGINGERCFLLTTSVRSTWTSLGCRRRCTAAAS
jgi:hypothetical protein